MISFAASLDHLYPMLAIILDCGRSAGFSDKQLKQIELAAEEALVNIISYSYHPAAQGVIELECTAQWHKELQLTITDQGMPYNPLIGCATKDKNQVGGNGIPLLFALMDEMRYHRDKDKNVLKLTKFYENGQK